MIADLEVCRHEGALRFSGELSVFFGSEKFYNFRVSVPLPGTILTIKYLSPKERIVLTNYHTVDTNMYLDSLSETKRREL